MGAVRGYNNDCRDCNYYRDNYHFAFVGDDGRDYFKCAKCSDRSRVFSDRYGYTCSNLLEIYDVELSERQRRDNEDVIQAASLGALYDDLGKYSTSDNDGCAKAFLFWFLIFIGCVVGGWVAIFCGVAIIYFFVKDIIKSIYMFGAYWLSYSIIRYLSSDTFGWIHLILSYLLAYVFYRCFKVLAEWAKGQIKT